MKSKLKNSPCMSHPCSAENFEELTLHDIRPPENLPQSYHLWMWGGILCGFAILSGIAVIVIIRKRKKTGDGNAANKIPAHLQAL